MPIGNRGCLETVVSVTEIHRQLGHIKVQNASPDKGLSLASVTNDPVAARVVTEAGRTPGRVLAEPCNCLNPAAIILGGELGTAGRPLVEGVRESIDRNAQPATAQAKTCATLNLSSDPSEWHAGPPAAAPPLPTSSCGTPATCPAHAALYRLALGERGSSIAVARLRNRIASVAMTGYARFGQDEADLGMPVEIAAASVAGSLLGMLTAWLESTDPAPPEQVAAWIWNALARPRS